MKYEETAKRLKKHLDLHGYNQQTLANKSGVGKSAISHYANGTHKPTLENATKIANVLGLNPYYLMGEISEATQADILSGEIVCISDEASQVAEMYDKADKTTQDIIKKILNIEV